MNTGKIVEVSSSVVDVYFEQLPKIKNALKVTIGGKEYTMEVAEHIGDNIVRCLMLGKSEGLYRGQEVVDTGDTIMVPVGEATLGRMFNCLGEVIDDKTELQDPVKHSIFRDPPKFSEQNLLVKY